MDDSAWLAKEVEIFHYVSIFGDNTLVIMKYCDMLWLQTYNSYYTAVLFLLHF